METVQLIVICLAIICFLALLIYSIVVCVKRRFLYGGEGQYGQFHDEEVGVRAANLFSPGAS